MQQKGLDLRAEVGDQERRLMRHEAANEMHVARQSIELGDRDRARFPVSASPGQRGIGRRMIPSWLAPVASFKIGDEEVRNTRLRIAAMSLPNTDMLLGADFFLSHRVYVANSQHRIYFTYNGGPVFNLASTPLADPEPKPDNPADKAPAAMTSQPSASAKRAMAAPWASSPSPERPCSRVLTR